MSLSTLPLCDRVHDAAKTVNLKGKARQVFIEEARDYSYGTQSLAGAVWRIKASRLKPGEQRAAFSALRKLAEKLGHDEKLVADEGGVQ